MLGFRPVASQPLASGPLEELFRVFQVLCFTVQYSPERVWTVQYSPERTLSAQYSPERELIGNVDYCQ